MQLVPITLKQANVFVAKYHRHHIASRMHMFSLGCSVDGVLRGVAIVSHPQARMLCDGYTLEVLRLCSDGYKNVCSFLYAACAKAAKSLGYKKIVTYILEEEPGVSLKASGWVLEKEKTGGGSWDTPSRRRYAIQTSLFGNIEKYPIGKKKRYAKYL